VLDTRRREHVWITLDGEPVMLRGQAPLHLGNMRLDDGWGFERFVRHLNDHVFFWPGGEVGTMMRTVRTGY